MQSVRRVLVAVKDPGARSMPGVKKAAQIAKAFGAQLELFHGLSQTILVDALDARVLSSSPVDNAVPSDNGDRPLALISENLDGKNHQVQMDVKSYAEGRTEALSALGWRRYLASMDLFSEFAASYVVGRMIQSEWIRLAGHEARGEEARN